MRVLALDLAKHLGWAFGEPDTEPEWGSEKFGQDDLGRRFIAFATWLSAQVDALEPELIVFEKPFINPRLANLDTSRSLLTMCGLAEMVAIERGLRKAEVPIGTWRKHFIGHGSNRKGDIKQDCIDKCEQHGWIVDNDNEADALGIWSHACDRLTQTANRILGRATT